MLGFSACWRVHLSCFHQPKGWCCIDQLTYFLFFFFFLSLQENLENFEIATDMLEMSISILMSIIYLVSRATINLHWHELFLNVIIFTTPIDWDWYHPPHLHYLFEFYLYVLWGRKHICLHLHLCISFWPHWKVLELSHWITYLKISEHRN